ncbi:MAG: KAP family NTPase [Gammaproteobacteria bacterium]|nr:KAP family NTPase [Gammaproteobacteria bacterium]MDH5803464.1 KAP family NTPase [Gammaproteobacteria bacterium]
MKLTVPPIAIADDEGFTDKNDIFKREDFGKRIANLVENSGGDLVLALDAQWGEGKTTFIKQWQGYIGYHRDNKIDSIYFDAFANDYQKDPFLALTTELYEQAITRDKKFEKKFIQIATAVTKSLVRGAVKIGLSTATGGIVSGTALEPTGNDLSQLVSDQVDTIVADRLKNSAQDKRAIENFRDFLKELVNNKPLVFIIDELDRCRPDFALELIEQIKHLFSVPGLTFLLVVNRAQLEEMIKAKYGSGINGAVYLQKFVSIWLALPRRSDDVHDDVTSYVDFCIKAMWIEGEPLDHDGLKVIKDLVRLHQTSNRGIERILTNFAIISNAKPNKHYLAFHFCIGLICFIRSEFPELLTLIKKSHISAEDLFAKLFPVRFDTNQYQSLKDVGILLEILVANVQDRPGLIGRHKAVVDNYGSSSLFKVDILNQVINYFSHISVD